MLRLLALIALVGCAPPPWGIVDITVDGDTEFQARVAVAADHWNTALYESCGEPVFRIVEIGGEPVREYGAQEWLDRGYNNTTVGFFDGDQIGIRCCLGDWAPAVTLHELGHSLGLRHIAEARDPLSAMHEVAFYELPSSGDVERAAEKLGCSHGR